MSRFVIVTELYWPSIGGQEVRYRELSRHLVAAGHTVEVLTIATEKDSPVSEVYEGVTIRRLTSSLSYRRPNRLFAREPLTIMWFSILVFLYFFRHTQDCVIFNQWPLLPQLMCGHMCRGVTLVDWCEHRSGALYRIAFSLVSKSTNRHIAVSAALRALLIAKYGIRSILTVPSGIECSLYKSHAVKEGMLFLGRLAAHKHPELVLAAVKLVQQSGLRMSLTIAGDGPLRALVDSQAHGLPYVHVVGAISEEEKRRLFGSAWLHLLPSEREGFPRTVAEAMACGTPTLTVSSPDNGGKDVVVAFNSGIVSEPNPQSLAEAIIALARDTATWQELSNCGLRASRNLDWGQVSQELIAFVEA